MVEFKDYLEPAMASLRQQSGFDEAVFVRALPVIRERLSVRSEFVEMFDKGELNYLWQNPGVRAENSAWKNSTGDIAKKHLEALLGKLLEFNGEWTLESLREVVMPYAEEYGKGDVLWPLRFTLTGLEKSPDPFTVMYILGKQEVLVRLKSSLAS